MRPRPQALAGLVRLATHALLLTSAPARSARLSKLWEARCVHLSCCCSSSGSRRGAQRRGTSDRIHFAGENNHRKGSERTLGRKRHRESQRPAPEQGPSEACTRLFFSLWASGCEDESICLAALPPAFDPGNAAPTAHRQNPPFPPLETESKKRVSSSSEFLMRRSRDQERASGVARKNRDAFVCLWEGMGWGAGWFGRCVER